MTHIPRRRRGHTTVGGLSVALALLLAGFAFGLAGRAHTARAAGSTPLVSASRPILNPFGQSMFGISGDGSMQDESHRTLVRDLNSDQATGAKWLRAGINWAQIQPKRRGPMHWARIDAVVRGAEARGMSILGVMQYTPSWAGAVRSCHTSYCAPNPIAFARFAQVAVAHYSRLGVHAYEIWNEENSVDWWLPKPSPAAYAQLLKDAYPVIKQADPQATVITGGTSPAPTDGTNYRPVDFLIALYRHGARGYFDAVGAHPYCWPAYPGQNYEWSAWHQTIGAKRSLRNVMLANGDGAKPIWGTEFGAATFGPRGTYVSPATQAKMIYAGYKLWSTYPWAGPLILFEGRDESTYRHDADRLKFLGLEYHNFVKKPGFSAYQRAVQSF